MATVAAINTNFTATTGNFEKGSKRVEKLAASMGSRIRGNLAAVIPGFGQLVSATAIGYLAQRAASAFKSRLDELGALSDASVNLGIATDQLQSLRFGASQAGVSSEQLDKAIAKMSDTIADAADGDVKEAVDVMKALGLSAQELVRIRPDQQIRKVSDALANVSNTSRRIQQSRDIFGRAGPNLIAFLQGGSKGIDDADKLFRKLGGSLSEIDVAAADNASDALDRITISFTNLGNQIAVGAAPGITLFAEALSLTAGAAANAARSQFALSKAYAESSKEDSNTFQSYIETLHRVRASLIGFRADLNESFGDLDEADRLRRIARASANIAAGGEVKAGNLIEQDFQRILAAAEEAARRAQELRGLFGEDAGDAAAKAARRSISPAAVEFGTTAAIEAINKATGGGSKVPEKQLRVLERIEKGQEDVARAIGDLNFEPADLE